MNDILPKARGDAARITAKSQGYREEIVSQAKGNTFRFNAIYNQYKNNKNVTKDRLYLETLESILKNSDKVIMSDERVLPHMSIQHKYSAKNNEITTKKAEVARKNE